MMINGKRMNVKFLIVPLILFAIVFNTMAQNYTADNQLSINTAGLQEIRQLPVSEQIAQKIYDRITYRGYLKSVYDLLKIEGVDQSVFEKIKPLVRIEPFAPLSTIQEKIEQIYFRLDRWSSGEV